MAKRRRLAAPDAAALKEMEHGFAAKPLDTNPVTPPIAQVAGEAAALAGMATVTDRAEAARDKADATSYRQASEAGLMAELIGLEQIDADYIRRDRIVEDPEALAELIVSIREHGLRNPIEVAHTDGGYGLISGYRRLRAFQELAAQASGFESIPAFVRGAEAGADAYVRMVEENEVRANLSHYERGRIAVLSVGQGIFPTVEAAVDALFAAASKSKRSKVRSFAVVHEALGDLLRFPTMLSEKAGLKLAAAVRDGAQAGLRAALATADPQDGAAEWKLLEAALAQEPAARDPAKGGRPVEVSRLAPVTVQGGGQLRAQVSGDGLRIELKGRAVDSDVAERILQQVARMLA